MDKEMDHSVILEINVNDLEPHKVGAIYVLYCCLSECCGTTVYKCMVVSVRA